MGKMIQEVAHSQGGCNSRLPLMGSAEMSSKIDLDIEDCSPVLRCKM